MKRCPSCNRTYADDRMMNCGHDGAPLMAAAYSPHDAPPIPPPQAYMPPPPPGYPPPAHWQNYPPPGYAPPGYTPQNYPPLGWQQAGTGEYVQCPRCTRPDPEKMKFTWWGGVIGPRMFSHVKCRWCGMTYNGKTGKSNTTNIVIYSVIVFIIFLGIGVAVLSIR
ncbi:MAG TPA: hypothetical protein VJT09_10720 [Pyrinomonadaceae bacterium]|nr:hypothetical protein [Pyrinomonadaceae bacterium]